MTYLFGATSMLGWALARRYASDQLVPFCNPYSRLSVSSNWPRLRLEDASAIKSLFSDGAPDILIHCGGICDVDKCEEDPDWAKRVNVRSIETLLAQLPQRTRLVYCSSDHVFTGKDEGGYHEDTPVEPLTVYGKTRVEAEQIIMAARPDALVVRWALAIGNSADGRSGHLDWLRHRTAKGLPTTVVSDEQRSAVWVDDLADRVWDLARSDSTGLRHVTSTRCVSRLALAKALNDAFNIGAALGVEQRADRDVPHLGRIELSTRFSDALAAPLSSPVDSGSEVLRQPATPHFPSAAVRNAGYGSQP